MANPELEQALRDLETTANSFAVRLIRMAEVRTQYVQQIRETSQSIRQSVEAGTLSAKLGAELANQMRNEIMEMARARDFDLGRSLAQAKKSQGITLETSIQKAMGKLGHGNKPFTTLTGEQQRAVLLEVIEASGRSRAAVTAGIPRVRWAARGLWLATLLIAAYNIGTAENPWWQTGREAANVGGGLAGGFAGGAAMGAAGGIWAGPVGVAVGVVVGGVLGALLADHTYVEVVGTSNPATRAFVSRFTSFWTGVDEAALAKALTVEHRTNPQFVASVFGALDADYSTDADDVAVEYINLLKRTPGADQVLRTYPPLRELLIRLLDDGWTSGDEIAAIKYLKSVSP